MLCCVVYWVVYCVVLCIMLFVVLCVVCCVVLCVVLCCVVLHGVVLCCVMLCGVVCCVVLCGFDCLLTASGPRGMFSHLSMKLGCISVIELLQFTIVPSLWASLGQALF